MIEQGHSNHLSFLDVMACGLGSMLFLFFIFVAFKQDFQFQSIEKMDFHSKTPVEPLVILIFSEDKSNPCLQEREAWSVPTQYDCKLHSTPYFGVLYADKPPMAGQHIWIAVNDGTKPVAIQIFSNGKARLRRNAVKPESFSRAFKDGRLCLWPVPEE